jgi:hypothetical protein
VDEVERVLADPLLGLVAHGLEGAAHVEHAHVGRVHPHDVLAGVEQGAEALFALAQRLLGLVQQEELPQQVEPGHGQRPRERGGGAQLRARRAGLVSPGEQDLDEREEQHRDERDHRRAARALPGAVHGRRIRRRLEAVAQRHERDPDERQRPGQVVEARVVRARDAVGERLVGDAAAELQQHEGGREPGVDPSPGGLGEVQRPEQRGQQREPRKS